VKSEKDEAKGEEAKKEAKPAEKKPEDDLKEQLAKAQNQAGEYLQMAQRLQADFDNYRKRTLRENEEFRANAAADLIAEMLNVVDDLDRALAQSKEENDFVKGVRGVRQNLMKTLESKGVKEIPTDGKFDPNCHEALCVAEADTDGNIAEVFQKGYRLGNKVLRYSKVKVTKKRAEPEHKQAEEEKKTAEPAKDAAGKNQ
jgi:molecular chaperone GrpE